MEFVPGRGEAHLIVSSIRVLTHLRKRPPTPEEIAEQLGLSRELVLHILRGLEGRGIVHSLTTPFEVRVDVADHRRIEELPEVASGPDMDQEIEDFHKRSEDRQKKIEQMMRDGDPERRAREKASQIEEEFRKFRGKKGSGSPFRGPAGSGRSS